MKIYSPPGFVLILATFVSGTTGCSSRDVATTSDVQEISDRLDDLIGDLQGMRKSLSALLQEAESAPDSALANLEKRKDALRDSFPVLAGIELSTELAAVDWLVSIRKMCAGDATVEQLLDAEDLLGQVPPTLDGAVAQKISVLHAEATIRAANKFVGDAAIDVDSLDAMRLLLERLQPNGNRPNESLVELTNQLKSKSTAVREESLAAEVGREVESLSMQLRKAANIANKELRRTAFLQISQTVDSIRLRFALEQVDAPEQAFTSLRKEIDSHLAASYKEVEREQEQRLAKARMKYQEWALKQIANLNQKLKDSKDYKAKHDLAVEFLLPINQNLLEPPVAKFYNEAFEKIWKQIDDGKGMQLSLATKTAEVSKRTLESFMEVPQ